MHKSTILSFLLLFLLGSCSDSGESQTKKPQSTPSAQNTQERTDINQLLNEAYAKVNPAEVNYYFNGARGENFLEMAKTGHPQNAFYYWVQAATELLNAGNFEKALLCLEECFPRNEERYKTSDKATYEKNRVELLKLKAITYLRQGEILNCNQNHNAESCIFPIQGKGIHQFKDPSQSAFDLFTQVLAANPKDYESIWLLNIANQSLGKPISNIPSQFQIIEDRPTGVGIQKFKDVSAKAGVGVMGLSGGTCLEDFNNDGFLDIVANSWGFNDITRFFLNLGNGKFMEGTNQTKLANTKGGLNMVHMDYNNDGFADLYVMRGAWMQDQGKIPNSLLRNNQDGTFTDVTIEVGLLSSKPTQTCVWADFNQDGWLDLFVPFESTDKAQFQSELYLNDGRGNFSNQIEQTSLKSVFGYFKGCSVGDVNNDGKMDLYFSNYFGPNKLFIQTASSNSIGLDFKDISATAKVEEPFRSFPTWFFDYDNDGLEDLFVSGYGNNKSAGYDYSLFAKEGVHSGNPTKIYKNNGDLTFRDMSAELGIIAPVFTMGCNYGDFNNDGFQDLYLATGDPNLTSIVPNKAFLNQSGKRFEDVTTSSGLGHLQKGHGVGFADFDNDGDQDIYCVLGGAYEGDPYVNALFSNPGNGNNWVTLELAGTISNRKAIGTKVVLTITENGKERKIHRRVGTGGSFGSSSLQLEIGLGKATTVDKLEITWMNKEQSKVTYTQIPANRILKITEGSEKIVQLNKKKFDLDF